MRFELPSPRWISATIVAAALTLAGCTEPTPPVAAGKAAAPPPDRSAVAEPAVPAAASAGLADVDSEVFAQSAYRVIAVDWRWRTDPSGMLVTATSHTLETHHAEWLDAPVAPGSIAKIATLNAALAAGVVDAGTRIICTRRVMLADGRRADCSHPVLAQPLGVVDALAHSCNVFTTTVARRLTREQLSSGLVTMGLPPLQTGEDPVAAAIGLGAGRVTASGLLDTLERAVSGRTAIRDGLARAADVGTASAIGAAGVVAFAKTGTSRMPSGASLGLAIVAAPRPVPTRLAVVLVPGGAGADAAAIAARLLRSYLRPTPQRIRLGRARNEGGYDKVAVDLEDYVAEVVAGESSGDTPAAAREALAIAARTFALANRGRHEAEGFDLCSLTHCQVVRPPDVGASRAADATDGRVLQAGGHVVPVFYSAACGGILDAATALTGGKAATPDRPWMQARPDPAGVAEPGWKTTIEARAFAETLRRAGFRGADLRDLRVDRKADGRVRRVHVVGFEPASLGIDDFRRLVGRDLGWQVVRSTSFEVTRTAAGYELQGRGHGHGVGLCVYGASAMARAGRNADDLLAAYFPGLTVSAKASAPTALRVRLPADAERHRTELEATIARELSSLARETGVKAPRSLMVVVHPTVASYQRATGRAWWTAGVAHIVDGPWVIETIPLAALRSGGRLESTLRHELAHVLIDGEALAPVRWVREGLAMHFAGEHPAPLDAPCPTDSEFVDATRETSAAVYRRAATCVSRALARGVAWRDIGK